MKQILTLAILLALPFAYGQSKMSTPTKIITINNEGNPIQPLQKKNVRKLPDEKTEIKKSDFKKMPKKKQKLILQEPEKYIIIED